MDKAINIISGIAAVYIGEEIIRSRYFNTATYGQFDLGQYHVILGIAFTLFGVVFLFNTIFRNKN